MGERCFTEERQAWAEMDRVASHAQDGTSQRGSHVLQLESFTRALESLVQDNEEKLDAIDAVSSGGRLNKRSRAG